MITILNNIVILHCYFTFPVWKRPQPEYEFIDEDETRRKFYRCTECGKKCQDLKALRRHQITHTQETPYSCSKCGKGFKDTENRSKHETLCYKRNLPFICADCGKKFAYSKQLLRHEKTCTKTPQDSAKSKVRESKTKSLPFICGECDKTFADSSSLSRHEIIHKIEENIKTENWNTLHRNCFHIMNLPFHCFFIIKWFVGTRHVVHDSSIVKRMGDLVSYKKESKEFIARKWSSIPLCNIKFISDKANICPMTETNSWSYLFYICWHFNLIPSYCGFGRSLNSWNSVFWA